MRTSVWSRSPSSARRTGRRRRRGWCSTSRGLGAPQGRDGSITVQHDMSRQVRIGWGYRAVEGGVDVTSIYNFAFIHYGLASVAYLF
jgi:hypothetical protein